METTRPATRIARSTAVPAAAQMAIWQLADLEGKKELARRLAGIDP